MRDVDGIVGSVAPVAPLVRYASEVSAKLRVLGDDVVVANVNEDVEAHRLQVGDVLGPTRIVELKAISRAFFLLRNVENFDSILL